MEPFTLILNVTYKKSNVSFDLLSRTVLQVTLHAPLFLIGYKPRASRQINQVKTDKTFTIPTRC